MTDAFNPSNEVETPVLPADRQWAYDSLSAIVSKTANVSDLIAGAPFTWAPKLTDKRVDEALTHQILDRIDGALISLEAISKTLQRVVPLERVKDHDAIDGIRGLMTALERLASQHRQAAMVGIFADFDEEEVKSVIYEVNRLADLISSYEQTVTAEDQFSTENVDLIRAAAEAAEVLAVEYKSGSIEEAHATAARLTDQDATIRHQVRTLSVVANRLSAPDITIDAIRAIASACGLIQKAPADVVAILSDSRPETYAIIHQAKDKAEKIMRVANLLDGRFGPAWRSEPYEKVRRASTIASTPDDPRHGAVGTYARSFGISFKYAENLASVTKALAAIDQFASDQGLTASLPLTFKGLQTDFGGLLHAVQLRQKLDDILGGHEAGEKLIPIFSRNSRPVIEDFFQYAALAETADALPFPGETPLRSVRGLHERRKERLREMVRAISNLPVAEDDKTLKQALRLSHLLRDIDKTRASIEISPLYITVGATYPGDLKAAQDWHDELAGLLPAPHTPKTDEQLAELLVASRGGLNAIMDWTSCMGMLRAELGSDGVPTDADDLTSVYMKLDELKSVEPILHGLAQLTEKVDEAAAGGLEAFIARMRHNRFAVTDWAQFLAEDYAIVDRAAAEDAFSQELEKAAQDAVDICSLSPMPVPVLEDNVPLIENTPNLDIWIEQQVSEVLSANGRKLVAAQ